MKGELPRLGRGDALIVTDVQNDFLPGGSLAVRGGEEVIPPLNLMIRAFETLELPVFLTRDWHPPHHCSFQESGGPWPAHCVQGTPGAAFSQELHIPPFAQIISKATRVDREAYSTFEGTELDSWLKEMGVLRLFIGGLTTDYCILGSVRDAHRLNYRIYVLEDAIRAVNAHPADGAAAITEMQRLGAAFLPTTDLVSEGTKKALLTA